MSVSLNPHKIPCQAPVQTGEAQLISTLHDEKRFGHSPSDATRVFA